MGVLRFGRRVDYALASRVVLPFCAGVAQSSTEVGRGAFSLMLLRYDAVSTMTRGIADFIAAPDRRHRHTIRVHAPADLVFDVAEKFDIESLWVVHALFWLRAKVLRAKGPARPGPMRLGHEMTEIGWGLLARAPGRLLVMGAATQPWVADVKFTPMAPDRVRAFSDPGHVKIAWTLETESVAAESSLLSTETRVVATDDEARRKFKRYWRMFGAGIVLIRWLLLPAVRREAERRFNDSRGAR